MCRCVVDPFKKIPRKFWKSINLIEIAIIEVESDVFSNVFASFNYDFTFNSIFPKCYDLKPGYVAKDVVIKAELLKTFHIN